jgi:hypothetical protein
VLHRVAPNGVPGTDVPLLGGVAINAITYDSSHDVFWGVDATGLNVYRIEKDGWVGLQFTLIPVLDLPGACNNFTGCSTTVTGLAYDATNDSLWYVPQGSQRVYHFNTAGQPLGYFDTANVPDCATNAVTGVAAGASVLYLTAAGCGRAFQYAKSDFGTGTKLSSFSASSTQSAGASCDNKTFVNKTALWVRDAGSGSVRAIEVAGSSCIFGGGVAAPDTSVRWMSGAGLGTGTETVILNGETEPHSEVDVDIQHAFHLLCDQAGGAPNNLVVNWKDSVGNHFSFHLETWTPRSCTFTEPTPASPPPCDPLANPDCFNTIVGEGLGRLTGRAPGGQLLNVGGPCNPRTNDTARCGILDSFTALDRGEPNVMDVSEFGISDPVQGNQIISVCGCKRANYQAHNRPH